MALDPHEQSSMAKAKAVSKVEDFLVPVKNGEIKVRVYTPNEKDTLPVFVNLHDGGWVAGNIPSVDALCQNIAHDAACIVVSVEYRLAPAF